MFFSMLVSVAVLSIMDLDIANGSQWLDRNCGMLKFILNKTYKDDSVHISTRVSLLGCYRSGV